MTTTVNTERGNEPLSVNTETEYVPRGVETDTEYVPAKSELPKTTEDQEVENFADRTAHKAAKTEQEFDATNNNLFSK